MISQETLTGQTWHVGGKEVDPELALLNAYYIKQFLYLDGQPASENDFPWLLEKLSSFHPNLWEGLKPSVRRCARQEFGSGNSAKITWHSIRFEIAHLLIERVRQGKTLYLLPSFIDTLRDRGLREELGMVKPRGNGGHIANIDDVDPIAPGMPTPVDEVIASEIQQIAKMTAARDATGLHQAILDAPKVVGWQGVVANETQICNSKVSSEKNKLRSALIGNLKSVINVEGIEFVNWKAPKPVRHLSLAFLWWHLPFESIYDAANDPGGVIKSLAMVMRMRISRFRKKLAQGAGNGDPREFRDDNLAIAKDIDEKYRMLWLRWHLYNSPNPGNQKLLVRAYFEGCENPHHAYGLNLSDTEHLRLLLEIQRTAICIREAYNSWTQALRGYLTIKPPEKKCAFPLAHQIHAAAKKKTPFARLAKVLNVGWPEILTSLVDMQLAARKNKEPEEKSQQPEL